MRGMEDHVRGKKEKKKRKRLLDMEPYFLSQIPLCLYKLHTKHTIYGEVYWFLLYYSWGPVSLSESSSPNRQSEDGSSGIIIIRKIKKKNPIFDISYGLICL